MTGGTISGNTSTAAATDIESYLGGGGVLGGPFIMSGGTISGNTAISSYGGGV
jgi:hypothetical protein